VGIKLGVRMSALGHGRTFHEVSTRSALPPKADMVTLMICLGYTRDQRGSPTILALLPARSIGYKRLDCGYKRNEIDEKTLKMAIRAHADMACTSKVA
jgi:hypothetical protein